MTCIITCADPVGPAPTALENHKDIGFLNSTGPDPLENHKATKPVFNVRPMAVRF